MPAEQTKVAITLIGMANWKEGKTFSGGELVKVYRGQVMTSLDKIAAASRVSKQTVRTSLRNLEKAEFLTCRSTNKFRIITILNYSREQSRERSEQHAEQQATGTQLTRNQQATGTQLTPIEPVNQLTREPRNQKLPLGDEPPSPDSSAGNSKPTPTSSAKTNKPKRPKPQPSETSRKAAEYLRTQILAAAPNCAASRLTPSGLANWARDLDKLEALSPGHTWQAIRESIDWLHTAENTFVVQSAASLAKKWDSIQANRKRSPATGATRPEDPYDRAERLRNQGAR